MTQPASSKDERVERMATLYRDGQTLEQVGAEFGVTRERVRQVLRKAGVAPEQGGAAVLRARRRLAKERGPTMLEHYSAHYGIDVVLFERLLREGATRAYGQQRQSARLRGIAFRLTLSEWWAVWDASGKWGERGCGKGRYCMSRIGDAGGYEVGNVYINSSVENSREAVDRWVGKTKAHPGVFLVYPGRDRAWQAKYGRLSLGYFTSPEAAADARAAYMQEHSLQLGRLGRGRGWTMVPRHARRPYQVKFRGKKSYHATPEAARAEYLRLCAEVAVPQAA